MNVYRASKYSRNAAVEYAKRYALKPNPAYRYFPIVGNSSGDCTNFTSQCLYAGGAPMIINGRNPWWYKHSGSSLPSRDSWSVSWAVAHSLYWTLKINQESNLPGVKGLEVSDINSMELGDVIFYEDNNRTIFHSAIITGFSQNQPLISQHSFEALNIPYLKTWKSPKYHFLKISI